MLAYLIPRNPGGRFIERNRRLAARRQVPGRDKAIGEIAAGLLIQKQRRLHLRVGFDHEAGVHHSRPLAGVKVEVALEVAQAIRTYG